MAGKLCFGSNYNNAGAAHLSSSKAFCEGVRHRHGGTAIARPITDNPHVIGSQDHDAWDAGWTLANSAAPGVLDLSGTCCAAVEGNVPA